MFKVIYRFVDLQDNNFLYEIGDEYPHEGYQVSNERLAELASSDNKIGRPLIKEIKTKKAEVEKPKQNKSKKSDKSDK